MQTRAQLGAGLARQAAEYTSSSHWSTVALSSKQLCTGRQLPAARHVDVPCPRRVDCCQLWELFFGAPRVKQGHQEALSLAPPPTATLAVAALGGPVGSARIKVIGVGGGGGNAVNRMIASGLKVRYWGSLLALHQCWHCCHYWCSLSGACCRAVG